MKIARINLVLAALTGLAGLAMPLHAELADGVQAIVNDTAITFAQVEEYTEPVAETLRRQYAGQPDALDKALSDALKDSLEQLVERQLILHDFDVEGYKLPDSVIDDVVQDRMREVGAALWQWLAEGAHIYICGDAKRMAKDVEAALVDIVAQHGARSTEDAIDFVRGLKKNGRFQADVY